jgi:hypothetical protein
VRRADAQRLQQVVELLAARGNSLNAEFKCQNLLKKSTGETPVPQVWMSAAIFADVMIGRPPIRSIYD